MAATVTHLPVKSRDLEGWEILTARHLLAGAVIFTPAERVAAAFEAASLHPEFEGVAQAMERLSGIRAEAGLDRAADESADLIREAASRR